MSSRARPALLFAASVVALAACRELPAIERADTSVFPPNELVAVVPPLQAGAPRATVAEVLKPAEAVDLFGARVNTVLPRFERPGFDPVASFVTFEFAPPSAIDEHQHLGFESLTYLLDGGYHHQDRLENDRIVRAGGVQWFLAAPEFFHSERPAGPGRNAGVQLWLKVPRSLLGFEPAFAQHDMLPTWRMAGYEVRAVLGAGSPLRTRSGALVLDVAVQAGQRFEHPVPDGWVALVHVLVGRVIVDELAVGAKETALLTPGAVTLKAVDERPARVIVFAGRPWGEPARVAGNFVE